jgi:propionate catabolism operon transcriptional regulator
MVLSQKLRIAAVGMGRLEALYLETISAFQHVADICVVASRYDDAIRALNEIGLDAIDVVVAAGLNGSYLRSHLKAPVVLISVTGNDLFETLGTARRISPAFALLTRKETPTELTQFSEAFALGFVCRSYRTKQDAEEHILELISQGIRVVIGSGSVTELAEKHGIAGVFLYSKASIRTAFESAIAIARASYFEGQKRERLDGILRHLREGIVAINLTGSVESINPAMCSILKVEYRTAVGHSLAELAPDLSSWGISSEEMSEAESIVGIGAKTYVVHRIPILEHGVATGVLMTFQESNTLQRLDRSLRSQRHAKTLVARYCLADLRGESAPMEKVKALATRYARSEATILILGESGTGKELLAQGIHNAGPRSGCPFVPVNCGAFPETLLESELFGYEEGAFTGASRGGKVGLFEAAHRGTLFLDEVGDMPLQLQTRLLRVLQEKEVVRLGATQPTAVDVRVITATNKNLKEAMETGAFRRDLFYRINILQVAIPPLREREEDIWVVAVSILRQILGISSAGFAEEILQPWRELLQKYSWPGNVRELHNVVQRIAWHYRDSLGVTQVEFSPQDIAPELCVDAGEDQGGRTLKGMGLQRERELITRVLDNCSGDKDKTCRTLGISRSTLWRRMRS